MFLIYLIKDYTAEKRFKHSSTGIHTNLINYIGTEPGKKTSGYTLFEYLFPVLTELFHWKADHQEKKTNGWLTDHRIRDDSERTTRKVSDLLLLC